MDMLPEAFVLAISLGSLVSEALILCAIILVLFIIFKIGSLIMKFIVGILANSVIGLISIFLLNYLFNLGIQITTSVLIATAVFGLPGVGTIVILKLLSG